jgi:dsDNA-binding SOS-regulon protein
MIYADIEWTEIILKVIEGLAGLAGTILCYFITIWANKHIKDEKIKAHIIELANIVKEVVLEVSQTFVDKMQKAGNWNDDTKKEALSMALSKAQSLMSDELKTWVSETYGDVTAYLTTLIEAQIKENSK